MRRDILPFLCAVLFFIFIFAGCQGGPVVPDTGSTPEITHSSSTSSGAGHHCLGYYTMVVDTENPSIDVLHARSGDLHINVVNVLNTTMGVSAVGVPSEHDPLTGLFVFDVTLTHPFGTKPQLAGFDVRGILMTPGSLNIGSLVFADLDETRLENADGYARWWNPAEFTAPGMFGYTDGVLANASSPALTATINPYKYFADSLGATDAMTPVYVAPMDADDGRGVFTAGSSNTRRYNIRFPMDPGPQVVFGYAVDASWEPPSPNPPTAIPDDFPINANQPEAYYVAVGELINSLYYDTETGSAGGVLRLLVNVHDWQGQEAGNIPAEVEVVRVFSPDLIIAAGIGEYWNETEVKARYTCDLFGDAVPSSTDDALVAVRVVCAGDATYEQGPAPAPSGGISSWNTLTVEVTDPECVDDVHDDIATAMPIDIGDWVTDVICPVGDNSDAYSFEIPMGQVATGVIRFYNDADPSEIYIFDETESLVTSAVTSSMFEFSFDDLGLLPGTYYILLLAPPGGDIRPYTLELDGELVSVDPCGAVDVTPSTLFMETYNVWTHENYVYLTGRYGVWVYDITDPANPVQTAHVDVQGHPEACFRYPYAYGLKSSDTFGELQLDLIDYSDPYAPVVYEDLVHYDDTADRAMCMDDELLCIEWGSSPDWYTLINDISIDPTSPVEVINLLKPSPALTLELTEIPPHGKYLVAGGYEEIFAYSVEDLGSITPLPGYGLGGGYAMDVTVDEDWVFLTFNTGSWDGFLYSLRLDPLLPGFVWGDSIDLPGASYNIIVDGSYAYIGDGFPGLSVCDISDPEDMTFGYSYGLIDYGAELSKSGDTLCMKAGNAGLEFFDMSDPTDPQRYPHLPVCNQPADAVLIGDYLYVVDIASADGALMTIDVSDPANAFIAAELQLPEEPKNIDGLGNMLLVSRYGDPDNAWMLIDAADPLNLSVITTVPEADTIDAVALTPDAIYIATSFPEVLVYDYSSLPPSNLGGIMLADDAEEISIGLDHMYVTTPDGVEILSLYDPLSPGYEGVYPASGYLDEARVAGEQLYIVYSDTLEVADLADPSSPTFLTSIVPDSSGSLEEITSYGQLLFVTGVETPLYAIQRLPADAPSVLCAIHEIDDYDVDELIYGNDHLYEFCYYTGIHIYEVY